MLISQATPVQWSRKIGLRLVAFLLGRPPPPFEVGGDASRQGHHAQGVGVLDAAGQVLGHCQQPRRGLAVRAAGRGRVGRLHRQGPGDPRRLARLERQEQPRAWKSAPRIVSTTLRPTPADQQTSIRVRSAGGDLTRGRARGNPARAAAAAPAATGAIPRPGAACSAVPCRPPRARSGAWRAPRRCAR